MLTECSKHICGQYKALFGHTEKKQPTKSEPKNVSGESLPEPDSPFTVAIIGAGIGGLTLAIGLLKENVPFVLYEAAAKYSVIGAGVGIGPNAVRAMYMIDPKLRDMYYETSSGNLTPGKENVMMDALYAGEGFSTPAPFGAKSYKRTSAHRRDLLNHLTSMIPRDLVRFSKRVVDVQQLSNRVIIRFEDGETVEHTAVIGADGVKGPIRRFVLGKDFPDEVAPTFTGRYTYRFTIPIEEAQKILGTLADDAKCFMGHGVNIMAYPISKGKEYNVVAVVCTEKPWIHEKWTHQVSKEEMLADFNGKVDERLIKMLDVSYDSRLTFLSRAQIWLTFLVG
jgi:salicylate hydroxylase